MSGHPESPPLRLVSETAPTMPDEALPWWKGAGDPLLAQLIEQGLAHDPVLICQAFDLTQSVDKAHAPGLRNRLTHLIAQDDDTARRAQAYAYADARNHLAERIALAYIEARRWQERLAVRVKATDPLRDNGEIAHFRKEAGLVPAMDGDMADVMTGLDTASVEAARNKLNEAIGTLARLIHALPDDLRGQLGNEGHLPALAARPANDRSHRADLRGLELRLTSNLTRHKVEQDAIDSAAKAPEDATGPAPEAPAKPAAGKKGDPKITADARAKNAVAAWRAAQIRADAEIHDASGALDTATLRLAPLAKAEATATRTVTDARLGYRSGTETFSMLYVAEAAVLAAQEGQIDARAAAAAAAVRLWSAQGLGWHDADLAPAPTEGVTVCVQP
ncbi:TolC family protein [Novosphingobium rosa]|uniref:TolC family protein n=1 Tax=Novosphingobium rosa TaxID=76978 RepID=UPI001471965C|nr:TolC family protein [Novosphingobium rosa]